MGKISLLFFWIIACMTAEVTAASDPIRIGVTVALSGDFAPMGNMYANGLRLWEKKQNAKGGILGRPVVLTIQDDQGNPETAARLYREMLSRGRVDLVFGPYSSVVSEAVIPVLEEYRYPTLMPLATCETVWGTSTRYVFGVTTPDKRWTRAIFTLLASYEVTRVAVFVEDSLKRLGTPQHAHKWAHRLGLNILIQEALDEQHLGEQLRRARECGAEAVLVWGYFKEAVVARKALAAMGWTPRVFFSQVGPASETYNKALGNLANYALACSVWEPEVGKRFPGGTEFLESFRLEHKTDPSYHAANSYAAGIILAEAVTRTGSIDREKIRQVLSTLDTITLIGRYGVDERGIQIRQLPLIIQWQDGMKKVVWPRDMSAAPLLFPPEREQ